MPEQFRQHITHLLLEFQVVGFAKTSHAPRISSSRPISQRSCFDAGHFRLQASFLPLPE
jgi:hypothetical protein